MAQQGSSPSSRSGGSSASRSRRPRQAGEDFGTDERYPPWAGLAVEPRWADHDRRARRLGRTAAAPAGEGTGDGPGPVDGGGAGRYGSRRRAAWARARRGRRTRLIWGGALVAVVIIAGLVTAGLVLGRHPRPHPGPGGLVTTYLPGEFTTVPDACSAVAPATLAKYLPGQRRRVVPGSLAGKAESLCDWSVDAPPMYRLLEVTVQAYAPSGLASGNGSATSAAKDAYQQARQAKLKPPKATHLPKAAVSQLHGLGSVAFAALQVPSAGGDTTDLMTVVVRDHNALVTVVFDGLAHSTNGRYAGVSTRRLRAGAIRAARDILARLH